MPLPLRSFSHAWRRRGSGYHDCGPSYWYWTTTSISSRPESTAVKMFAQELTEVRSGKNCELAQTIYDAIRMKPEERVGVGEGRR